MVILFEAAAHPTFYADRDDTVRGPSYHAHGVHAPGPSCRAPGHYTPLYNAPRRIRLDTPLHAPRHRRPPPDVLAHRG